MNESSNNSLAERCVDRRGSGRLTGKVALVTGGSSGIGRAAAIVFAREGARVLVVARRRQEGEETARIAERAGGSARFFRGDVTVDADCRAMVEEVVRVFGRLDIAFNNAGVDQAWKSIENIAEDEWDRTIEANLKGVFLAMKYEVPAMLDAGGGAILNTSSVAGLVGIKGGAAYNAAKFGVVGLTKGAALDLAKKNIRVNAICPGGVATEMLDHHIGSEKLRQRIEQFHPMGRLSDPFELAESVLFLASDDASFITGQAFAVDGGLTVR